MAALARVSALLLLRVLRGMVIGGIVQRGHTVARSRPLVRALAECSILIGVVTSSLSAGHVRRIVAASVRASKRRVMPLHGSRHWFLGRMGCAVVWSSVLRAVS